MQRRPFSVRIVIIATLAAAFAPQASGRAAEMPPGFVYLADRAPKIVQDMRYAGKANFTRARVPGYRAPECVLATSAAGALARAQNELQAAGYGLMVLDCYRPAKAVRHFMDWARQGDRSDQTDPDHHPRLARNRLVAEGYIARRSGHSTGYVVDLTLTDASGNALDMGTPFDFFDPAAHTASREISSEVAARRRRLVAAMRKAGFDNYRREWWHFSLRKRPRDAPAHDFDILPRQAR